MDGAHDPDDPMAAREEARLRAAVGRVAEAVAAETGAAFLHAATRELGETLGCEFCAAYAGRDSREAAAIWRRAPDGPLDALDAAAAAASYAARGEIDGMAWAAASAQDGSGARLVAVGIKAGALGRAAPRLLAAFVGRIADAAARLSAERERDLARDRLADWGARGTEWLWETDAEHRFSYLSFDGADDHAGGLVASDMIGRTMREAFGEPNPAADEVFAELDGRLARREPFSDLVYPVEGKDGRRAWLRAAGAPRHDAEGRFLGYRGVGANVSDLLEAERRAERSSQALLDGIEAMSAGFALFDAGDRLVLANRRLTALGECPGVVDIAPGVRFEEIVRSAALAGRYGGCGSPEDVENFVAERMRRHREADGRAFEMEIAGGRWVEVTERRTAAGGRVLLRTDITRLKQAEARLRDAIARVPVGLIICGPDDRVLTANDRYRELYPELADAAEPGAPFLKLCEICGDEIFGRMRGPDFEGWLAERLERHRNPGPPVQFSTTTGRTIFVSESRMSDGGYIGVHVDVTELALLQERLALMTVRAEAALAARSRFLANMSHDLRTPLNAVIGFADLIAQQAKGPAPATYVEWAEQIKKAGVFLLSLIVDVLDLSRVEAGRMPLDRQREDPRAVIVEAAGMLCLAAERKGVSLEIDLPAALPDVMVERRRMAQIVQNLVSNAVKFTDAGGVTVTAAPEDGMLRVTVRDTGRGMSARDVEAALTPFQQTSAGDSTAHRDGSGLGLPLARAMTELHGGELSIESAPGAGTAVSVTLPLAD